MNKYEMELLMLRNPKPYTEDELDKCFYSLLELVKFLESEYVILEKTTEEKNNVD